MLARERVWRQFNIRAVLPTIQVPTLVLHRTGDPVDNVEAGRHLAARIPGGTFVELPGHDWLAWAGDQARLLEGVESFLKGIRDEEASFDRALATVLFTDVVNSTVRLQRLAIRDGRSCSNTTTPWCARSSADTAAPRLTPRAAVSSLRSMGRLAGQVRASVIDAIRPFGIEVLTGVHRGEVETIAGKVGGLGVVIGARVGALVGASEVLTSQTVDRAPGPVRSDDFDRRRPGTAVRVASEVEHDAGDYAQAAPIRVDYGEFGLSLAISC